MWVLLAMGFEGQHAAEALSSRHRGAGPEPTWPVALSHLDGQVDGPAARQVDSGEFQLRP